MTIEEIVGSDTFPHDVVVGNNAVILRWYPDMFDADADDLGEKSAPLEGDRPEIIWAG